MTSESKTIPSVFVGVGGPRQIWDDEWNGKLHSWAESMPRPEAILMFSAHWARFPITLGARETVPLTYDYYNFPKHFYDVQYPAPPAPTLADRFTREVVQAWPTMDEAERREWLELAEQLRTDEHR